MLRYPFSIAFLRLTLAFPRLPVKGCAVRCSRRISSQLEVLASLSPRLPRCSVFGASNSFFGRVPNGKSVPRACYTSRFPMSRKLQPIKQTKKKPSGAQMIAHAELPTRYGRFTIYGFKGRGPQEEAVALVRGNLKGKTAPLVRVHSQCLTGDVLMSLRCDCRAQLELSLKKIGRAPSGILLYLPQEGRGIGLMNKLRAYELQDGGMDTVEANETLGFAADVRDYEFSAQILKKLGAKKIRLLSNNPEKVRQLEDSGIQVAERVPCQPRVSKISSGYLKTKKRKMGHLLKGI
jgi:GTP cyclohydrolase II